MATVLDTFHFTARHGNATYAWSQWFDGQVWMLTRDVDFHTNVASFRSTVYGAARKLGVKVTIRIVGDDVIVQAHK